MDTKDESGLRVRRRRKSLMSPEYAGITDDGFQISYVPNPGGVFKLYLYGTIVDASQLRGAVEVLDEAGADDTVEIHLSTPGGSLDATDTFLASMDSCEARVIVLPTGSVCSAGTIIMMHAKEFVLSDNVSFLFHNGGYSVDGKFSDNKAQVDYTHTYMETLIRTIYEGFLTDKEIEQLIEGKDFWMEKNEFMQRWHARDAHFSAINAEKGVDKQND